ncbi:adenosylcobinamide-GDP ribazoletransferase [Limosilactobacillus sp. RRLNB_1_1]|uniref:Adenosylcobinamide-GDP ribazoletransferase n=1 Tax=Limosilactobacillus albertensis TaxID=2759752 RepID=A0A7W3Y8J4_9LACO|nr:adenosylcobinamide-GDP ribazoletransferase [Limosilactobacillus albertensis]MBB1069493.1 adenosylcobinamide-GDP ribazoletransferase [Limosilactobacillus albertensis]MCD7118019.1 adenosylcobinamide-GDP ribazoletransferase [Limosilactobacillus albertensis]MCD7127727.1 adenosylcobinamide-GDP ribazoletransferase [Limosilactobacillus albertensis]
MKDALILFGQFFTKLNIPIPVDDAANKFKTSIQYITLFSFLLGCIEGLIFWGFTYLFPLWFAWILYWITDGLLTGGFHLDALADTADGFFSSRTSDKIFAIMKDSRLGTMGSLALLYYYALVIGLGIVISHYLNLIHMILLTICLTMLTKAGLSLLFYKMVYPGNKKGLSNIWLGIKTWRIIIAQVFAIIVVSLCFSWQGLVSYLMIPLVAIFYRRKVTKVLGGTPGDTLGAFASLSPLIFLVTLTVLLRFGL